MVMPVLIVSAAAKAPTSFSAGPGKTRSTAVPATTRFLALGRQTLSPDRRTSMRRSSPRGSAARSSRPQRPEALTGSMSSSSIPGGSLILEVRDRNAPTLGVPRLAGYKPSAGGTEQGLPWPRFPIPDYASTVAFSFDLTRAERQRGIALLPALAGESRPGSRSQAATRSSCSIRTTAQAEPQRRLRSGLRAGRHLYARHRRRGRLVAIQRTMPGRQGAAGQDAAHRRRWRDLAGRS